MALENMHVEGLVQTHLANRLSLQAPALACSSVHTTLWVAMLLLLLGAALPLLCCWCVSSIGIESMRGALRLWLEGFNSRKWRLHIT